MRKLKSFQLICWTMQYVIWSRFCHSFETDMLIHISQFLWMPPPHVHHTRFVSVVPFWHHLAFVALKKYRSLLFQVSEMKRNPLMVTILFLSFTRGPYRHPLPTAIILFRQSTFRLKILAIWSAVSVPQFFISRVSQVKNPRKLP